MNKKQHKERHKLLHQHLDELLADFISQTYNLPSKTTVMDLVKWSHLQTINPTNKTYAKNKTIQR